MVDKTSRQAYSCIMLAPCATPGIHALLQEIRGVTASLGALCGWWVLWRLWGRCS